MADLTERLEAQILEVNGSLNATATKFQELQGQRAEIDRQMAAVLDENVKLQGGLRDLLKLKGDGGNGKEKADPTVN